MMLVVYIALGIILAVLVLRFWPELLAIGLIGLIGLVMLVVLMAAGIFAYANTEAALAIGGILGAAILVFLLLCKLVDWADGRAVARHQARRRSLGYDLKSPIPDESRDSSVSLQKPSLKERIAYFFEGPRQRKSRKRRWLGYHTDVDANDS